MAPAHDSKEAMRFRAICDERITIPLDALKQFPEAHAKLVGQLPQSAMVDVYIHTGRQTHTDTHTHTYTYIQADRHQVVLGGDRERDCLCFERDRCLAGTYKPCGNLVGTFGTLREPCRNLVGTLGTLREPCRNLGNLVETPGT